MDCASEVQLIRIKLTEVPDIINLDFDVANRRLVVFHKGPHEFIFQALRGLQFDTRIFESINAE